MVYDPSSRRSTYRSPDAVIAEAHRMAADIRRRAERDANAVRREAAEWASATRREAERYREETRRHREQVLAELRHAAEAARLDEPVDGGEIPPEAGAEAGGHAARGSVIDLRSAAEARGTPMAEDPAATDPADDDDVDEVAPRPAVGGTYVVGHRPLPVETSIETKVHDVVRLAVRRTFQRRYP